MVVALDIAASIISKKKVQRRLVYISHQWNEDDLQVGVCRVLTQQMLFKYFLIL